MSDSHMVKSMQAKLSFIKTRLFVGSNWLLFLKFVGMDNSDNFGNIHQDSLLSDKKSSLDY